MWTAIFNFGHRSGSYNELESNKVLTKSGSLYCLYIIFLRYFGTITICIFDNLFGFNHYNAQVAGKLIWKYLRRRYSTYDRLEFKYKCNCESAGNAILDFADSKTGKDCNDELAVIKNRLCCPKDGEPLITVLDKKLSEYEMRITCKSCGNIYRKSK